MGVSEPLFSGSSTALETATAADPRLQPTPDYGTLGPGSDVVVSQPASSGAARPSANPRRFGTVFAAAIGLLAAVFAGSIGSAHAAWSELESLFSVRESVPASAKDIRQLDR